MVAWNSPYILAILLGLLAVGLYYFDQKQKKEETPRMSYVKVFSLTTGLILAFNYFADSSLPSLSPIQEVVSNPVIEKPTPSQSPSTNYTYQAQSQTSGNNTVSNNGLFGNLKIKEGPPGF